MTSCCSLYGVFPFEEKQSQGKVSSSLLSRDEQERPSKESGKSSDLEGGLERAEVDWSE